MTARAAPRRATSSPNFSSTVQRWAPSVAPPLATLLTLAIVLPLGVGSMFGAAVSSAALMLCTLLFAIGIERTATFLLLCGLVLAPLNSVRPVPSLTFVTASDVCLLVAIVLLLPVLLQKPIHPPAAFVVGATGVIAMGLISSAVNPDPFTSLNLMLRLVVGALILPIVFMWWRPRREVVVALAAAYVIGSVINVAAAVLSGLVSYENRYLGLTTHPNILGVCTLLALTLIPFLLQELPSRYAWVVLGAGIACSYGIWISGSRAAVLVAVAVAVVYPFLARSVTVAVILFGLAIGPLYIVGRTLSTGEVENNVLGRFLGGGSATASDQVREGLANAAIDQFVAHPLFGGGFGGVLEAHNIYLQIAAAGGVAVLVFYVVLLWSVVRQPFKIASPNRLFVLPAMGYAFIGPLTPLLWDRYIWCVLALPFLLPIVTRPTEADSKSDRLVLSRESP